MLKISVFSHPCSLFDYLRLFGFLYLWLTRSTIIICNTHNLLDVLVCSIAEYFCELYKQRVNILGNTTHHKPNSRSIIKLLYFICKSYKAEKWSEKRSVTHATDCSKMFFLPYKITKELTMFFRYFYWRRGRREVKSRRARLPFTLAPSRWIHRWLLCLFREFP